MIGLPPEPLIVIPVMWHKGRHTSHPREPHHWIGGPPEWRCSVCGLSWAHPRIPPVNERHVIARYVDGESYAAIAAQLHVSKARIRAILQRAGVAIRGGKRRRP